MPENLTMSKGSALEYKRYIKNFSPEVCLERALLVTESFKNSEAYMPVMRRAMALSLILDRMSIYIGNDEVIVGNQASQPFSAPIFPEYAIAWFEKELDDIPRRPIDRFHLPENTAEKMADVFSYWKGKTFSEKAESALPDIYHQAEEIQAIFGKHMTNEGDGHLIVDFEKVLRLGLHAIADEAKASRETLDLTQPSEAQRIYFLDAITVVCDAVSRFARRYHDKALLLSKTADPLRSRQLQQISANCAQVPMHPARTFSEALQSLWFIQLILQIESNGHSISLGRFDQYLYPYYVKDKQDGILTDEQALELIEHFWVKLNTINKIRPWKDTQFLTGYPMFQNVTLGGQICNGRDATNELTYLCLKATEEMMLPQPSLSARYHLQSPDEYIRACLSCIGTGLGMPALFNDEAIIPSLLNHGVDYADAENYGLVGCVEVCVPGKWGYRCNGMSYFNMLKVFELSLNNGIDPATGVQLVSGSGSLDEFTRMQDVWDAWEKQLNWYTRCYIEHDAIVDTVLEHLLPDPFCSMLVDDCIKRGLMLKEGGSVYDVVSAQSIGIANISNAMAAIQKLCFDTGEVTPAHMKAALDDNFSSSSGNTVRKLIHEGVPKYGNDEDYVDDIAVKLLTDYVHVLKAFKNARQGRGPIDCGWQISTSTVTSNVPFGRGIGATADGRYSGESLAEGCSPVQGTDISGPTASMNTMAKLPNILISGGQLYNMKLPPSALKGENNIRSIISLIRGYGAKKGWHVQFNVVDAEVLLDAQKRPERYLDLIVRVAGYSAYFVDLDEIIQNDIIRRTEHIIH